MPCAASVEDWSNVRLLGGAALAAGRVVGCAFTGDVLLGDMRGVVRLPGTGGATLPAGVYHSTLVGVTVEDGALVMRNTLLSNVYVGAGAAVVGCGFVTGSGSTTFGVGVALPLGLDGPGRDTPVYPDITVRVAAHVATHRSARHAPELERYAAAVSAYADAVRCPASVVCSGAVVANCSRVTDVYVGPAGLVEGSVVEDAAILSTPDEPSTVRGGATVRHALLQWSTEVDELGVVNEAVMCEHSHVDKHGKLLGSLLGPNSGVSEGEVSASLVGPFVGFHHQALLIAAMWPEGKGNVGYGANVGSNHTSKAPDQEIRPGEGVFFGLGVSVKFPSNFQRAPYSIIATGVVTLPQTLAFPFSLVNLAGESVEGLSPAINELFAGWVLSDSVFTVWRNQQKFTTRDRARRDKCDPEVFRPEIIDLMLDARARLSAPRGAARFHTAGGEDVWTDREIDGLGKNYLKESNRVKGVKAYTFYLRLYALHGLVRARQAGLSMAPLYDADAAGVAGTGGAGGDDADGGSGGAGGGSGGAPARRRWAHEAAILRAEFPGEGPAKLLERLRTAQAAAAEAGEVVKARDAKRGAKIIPDYNDVHPPASGDPVVLSLKAATRVVDAAVDSLVSKL